MIEEFLKNFEISQLFWIIDLLIATILGFFIGLERKFREKDAGLRTHTVVAFGSALMMIISKHAFGAEADAARIAAQIVAGVGFLGAGIIVYKKNVVHGLTTAAGVWATAGIGMACGGGLYIVAIIATVVLILIHFLLHKKIFSNKKVYHIKITFKQANDEREIIKGIFGVDRFNKLTIERHGEELLYQAIIQTHTEYTSTQLDEIMKSNAFINSLERCDLN